MNNETRFIIAVDIGTTSIRACNYDQECRLQFFTQRPISIIYSNSEKNRLLAEIDPDRLWSDFKHLVNEAIRKLPDPTQLAGLALCCQRNTFISWNAETLRPCHRLICWKDERAAGKCTMWNRSKLIKLINLSGKIGYFFTRSERFKAARVFKFVNAMVTHRFLATLETNDHMKELLANNQLRLGTMDTWLQLQMSNGRSCATDASSASSTGLFDPFTFDWGHAILKLVRFPAEILPEVKPTAGVEWGMIDKSIFGFEIPLLCSVADSQAAVYGTNCLSNSMVKISLGTGAFVNVVTDEPHSGFSGIYPLVGWSLPDDTTFVVEARANDTATCINWAQSVGLFEDFKEASNFDNTPPQSSLCFIPAFNGIQTPYEDNESCAAFMAIRPSTTKRQMLRALLESIVFTIKQIWDQLETQKLAPKHPTIRLCGGVSKNDFICQNIANAIGKRVERVSEPEFSSAKGAALLAGLTAGMWNTDNMNELVKIDRSFDPIPDRQMNLRYKTWLKAVQRCLQFY
ncbi:hypothetical protein M3Y95_00481100 [Aphelenchoides besseyi]|nr:hypothetical protein M3Y95_00481100 [Aphelenchoides besseyi]